MTVWKKLLCLLLAGVLSLGLAAPAGAAEAESGPRRALVLYEEEAGADAVSAAVAALDGVTLLWRYDRLFSGAAVEAGEKALAALAELDGVRAVCRTRPLPQAAEEPEEEEEIPGPELAGLAQLREAGFDGSGVVIAVLDSGLRTTHEAFAGEGPSNPAIAREDIEKWVEEGGTEGQYLSPRIPFAYDYCGRDDDVTTSDLHGTHITALAAGCGPDFSGAAPGAQILAMKVFPDNAASGADDAAVLRALEDALELGADIVNLSLGMTSGFTRDNVLSGLYAQSFQRLREEGVLLFCAAGNGGCPPMMKTWGVALPTTAYTDYGTVCSPGSYPGTAAVAAAGWTEAESGSFVSPAFYSAWGATSDLRLVPSLTTPGSGLLSAGTEGDDAYVRESGTSMACAGASGASAVLLQALRERGVTDRKTAADLTERLLESTAQVLVTAGGVPYSPRKQGCGFVDLAAALESPLAVQEPLLELGDSEKGRFPLTLRLENLTEEDVAVTLEAAVLTDGCGQRDGVAYSRLAPMDITGRVEISGDTALTVPAGGEAAAEVTLEIKPALQEELGDIFPNGFFVEGFLTARTEEDRQVHAAFLGYCGDWGAAPILDGTDFRDAVNRRAQWAGEESEKTEPYSDLDALNPELGVNMAYISPYAGVSEDAALLGENPAVPLPHSDTRNTIPNRNTDAHYAAGNLLYMELYTLRNAANLIMVVSDAASGEIYQVQDRSWLAKTTMDGLTGQLGPSGRFSWDCGSVSGPLPDGTQARVDFYAWLDWDSEALAAYEAASPHQALPDTYQWLLTEEWEPYRVWSFPVTVDSSAPAASWEEGSVRVSDGGCLAYAAVRSGAGEILAEAAFTPEEPGTGYTLPLEGEVPETLYVTAADYATNLVGWEIDTRTGQAARCPTALLRDVSPDDWYHEAVDFVWEQGLMRGSEPLAFQPEQSATRAQVICALYRAAGSPEVQNTTLPFTDVPTGAWYRTELAWAYEAGIAAGLSPTVFAAPANVTRAQLAALMYRFAGEGTAADSESAAVDWCRARGLVREEDLDGFATRAETAAALAALLGE